MGVTSADRGRRVLVRLDDGDDLLRGVEQVVEDQGIGRGWVRGVGRLKSAELAGIDAPGAPPARATRLDGPIDLLSLEGSIGSEDGVGAVTLFVSVASASPEGTRVTGGRVRRAEIHWAELVIESFSIGARGARPTPEANVSKADWADVGARVERDGERTLTEAPSPAPSKAPSWADVAAASEPAEPAPVISTQRPAAGPSWGDVAAASAPREEETWVAPPQPGRRGDDHRAPAPLSDEPSLALPVKGDFVQHRQFGVCRVDKEDGNGGIVIRLASGVRKTIKLSYMEVGAARRDGRRTIFPIRPRKKR